MSTDPVPHLPGLKETNVRSEIIAIFIVKDPTFSSPCIVRCRPNSLMLTWVQHAAHVDETDIYILGCRVEDQDVVIVLLQII